MQVQIKRRFMILLDEDEAEEFLDDATDVQDRVRDQLRSSNGHVPQTAATTNLVRPNLSSPAALRKKGGAKDKTLPNSSGRRAMKKVICPDCKQSIAAHWLERHRRTQHAAAQNADDPSVE